MVILRLSSIPIHIKLHRMPSISGCRDYGFTQHHSIVSIKEYCDTICEKHHTAPGQHLSTFRTCQTMSHNVRVATTIGSSSGVSSRANGRGKRRVQCRSRNGQTVCMMLNNNRLDDGGRAVGTVGVSHCVGMYIELGDSMPQISETFQEGLHESGYCCWHIECIPMEDDEFVDQVGSDDFKKVSKVIEDKLNNEVGRPSAQEVQDTLIIVCSTPQQGSMAMIDGILQWAGMKAEVDKAAFRQTERYNINQPNGFIVETPGDMTSVKWVSYQEGVKIWEDYWEAVGCGEPDGMPEILSTRQESLQKQENDEEECEVS